MKKSNTCTWAMALIGASAIAAHAQTAAPASGVSLYGLVDAGVEVVSNVGASGSLTRMPSNTGTLPSRVGMRGSEDLGGGLRGVFTLEMGLAPDQGSSGQGGRLFGRQAHVGLAGPWGSVTAGRQYSMLFWSVLDADVMGPAVYALGSLDSYLPNARADNSLAWRGTFNGLTLGAQYSTGRDTVNAGPGRARPAPTAPEKAAPTARPAASGRASSSTTPPAGAQPWPTTARTDATPPARPTWSSVT